MNKGKDFVVMAILRAREKGIITKSLYDDDFSYDEFARQVYDYISNMDDEEYEQVVKQVETNDRRIKELLKK
jgi:hypothetical protein